MIGGGGFRNFPRQVPKCEGVSNFMTKIVAWLASINTFAE